MKIKKEVKELCVKMRNSKTGSEEWKQTSDELQKKWRFTPFNLLALYSDPPIIEYNEENHHLVTEHVTCQNIYCPKNCDNPKCRDYMSEYPMSEKEARDLILTCPRVRRALYGSKVK